MVSCHHGKVMRPGDFVELSTVIRNWWAFPAVGFNSILVGGGWKEAGNPRMLRASGSDIYIYILFNVVIHIS